VARVNKYPTGFLDLLGAKTQGKTPPDFSEVLAGTVPLEEFYLADALSGVREDANHGGPSVFTLPVPQSEVWLVKGCSVTSVLTLATSFEKWAVQLSGLPRRSDESAAGLNDAYVWASQTLATTVAATRDADAVTFPVPFVLLPGNGLNFRLMQRDAGAARITEIAAFVAVLRS